MIGTIALGHTGTVALVSQRAQYVVVAVNVPVGVGIDTVPTASLNQRIVAPAAQVPVIVKAEPEQIAVLLTVGTTGNGFTVCMIGTIALGHTGTVALVSQRAQ